MNKKSKPLGGGVHQLNNNDQLFNLQLFADSTLNYNKVNNPYNFYLNKHTWTKGDIKKVYNLVNYYKKIPNYSTITTLPEENAQYIKEALPNVTSCICMMGNYYNNSSCKALTSIDTTGWDTSNIISMNGMFGYCNKLQALDVSKWNTSKVTNMRWVFGGCNELQALDVSKWNTSKVTDMDNMFYDCWSLSTLDLSNWDTSNVNDMSYMFQSCLSLTTITGIIDMKSCTSYDGMFSSCFKLTGVKIKNPPSGITATSGIGGLDAGNYEIVS